MLPFLSVQTLSSLSLFLVASFIWTSIWNYEWSYCWLFIIGCWTGKTRKQLTPWPSDKAGLYFSVVWMIITNFLYVSVTPWKNITIASSQKFDHRSSRYIFGVRDHLMHQHNSYKFDHCLYYLGYLWYFRKVRQLPTFFCCYCFSWCSVKNACSFVNDYEYFSRREESGA